jgi:hypothetical protein
VTFTFVDTDEPGVNEMNLNAVPPQPLLATESASTDKVSALAGWIPLAVALLVPLPVMAGHLTLPLATSVPPAPPCCQSHKNWEPDWLLVAVQVTDTVKPG